MFSNYVRCAVMRRRKSKRIIFWTITGIVIVVFSVSPIIHISSIRADTTTATAKTTMPFTNKPSIVLLT